MRWVFLIICLIGIGSGHGVSAQQAEEDKGRIALYLQEALSGLGREVRIDGFQGALSSRVSMDRMTIADADGVWLTLTDAVLDWNRAAILTGRINIDQISAASIELARLPVAEGGASPEAASSFSLPELPVSIDIKSISAKQVSLGAPIIGMPISLSVTGAVTLEGGEGQAALEIERLEGPRGVFSLQGTFANVSRQLAIDLTLDEAEDGITATLLSLPGRPALQLSVVGNAPIDEFVADIALKSDGEDRLAGVVSTQIVSADANPSLEAGELPRVILVDIAGDLAPLFAPQYQAFFGTDVGLESLVQLYPDGRVDLETLKLRAAALSLEGDASLSAEGVPVRFDIKGVVEDPENPTVILPISGPETRVRSAKISAKFDAADGDAWLLVGDLNGLDRPELALDTVRINASGMIQGGDTVAVTAKIDASAQGLVLEDPSLSRAIGEKFQLVGDIGWQDGEPLALKSLSINGDGMELTGSGQLKGLETAATFDGAFDAIIDDIARFADLADRPLSGGLKAQLDGQAALLTGAFDLELNATGSNLKTGIEQADTALVGNSTVFVSGKRDENGLVLRTARVETAGATADAKGFIHSGQTNFEFATALADLGQFVSGIAGPVNLSGEATQHDTGWLVDLEMQGPFDSSAKGRLAVPDDGEPSVKLTGEVGNVGAILPDLAGSASFIATARQQAENWVIDTSGQGPGGSTFAVSGQVRQDASTATLDIDGTLPLALANRRLKPNAAQGQASFDLRLDGPLAVSSLSGQLSTSGARVSLPDLKNALSDLDAVVTLSGQTAAIRANTSLATGGQILVDGRIGTQAPYAATLGVGIVDAIVRDPQLYETVADGNLVLSGAVQGGLNLVGQINLDRTEVRVPSSGLGSGKIPDIRHVNEPADVRRTRRAAGLLEDGKAKQSQSAGPVIGLDVLIVADNRVFIRGRGLDAELGGRFRVTGTTADIIPIGGFDLIRGRLDILGKRLTLDEGTARLQGDFIPGLRLVASTVSDDDTIVRIVIEGRADEPEVRFLSEPELPDDEVLARLLFGRELGSLSAFQALQLASAVATLAGRGGVGLAERVRQSIGVDDLSVTTDDEGNASLGVGKYIGDKVYTDVQIGDDENSAINLNIDLSRRTKLRGSFKADGTTGLGIFFEKDY